MGRCRSWSRRRCRGGYRALHLKGADVEAAVTHSIKTRAALVVERRRSKVRVTRINGRATEQQLMRECGATVVLQWAKHGIGVDLIARAGQDTAAVVAAEIVAERVYPSAVIGDVFSYCAGVEDGVPDPYISTDAVNDAATIHLSGVAADRAVAEGHRSAAEFSLKFEYGFANGVDGAAVTRRVTAERAVCDFDRRSVAPSPDIVDGAAVQTSGVAANPAIAERYLRI